MYFDMGIVLPKLHRILKRDGHFCILFTAWLPEESDIARKSEELILKYNPYWTGGNLKRSPLDLPRLLDQYFEIEHDILYDIDIPFTRESWNGRIKACRGIGASSMTKEEIAEFEKEHLAFLSGVSETFEIPHYVNLLNLRRRE